MRKLLAAAVLFAAVAANAANAVIGKKAPDFTLTDIHGKQVSLSNSKGKYTVLEWVNHGCPFVKKHYDTGNMQKLQKEMTDKGVVWLSICSSAAGKEGYLNPEEWQDAVKKHGSNATDTLIDASGTVGKSYGAKSTPSMVVINPEGTLIYKGAIDDKPSYDKEDISGAKNYVRAALDEAMTGKPVTMAETKSYGCSVKY